MNFKELGIENDILRAIDRLGYENPTPIQEQAIPSVLTGRDLMACAQTGTGKTAAFSLPILQQMGRPTKGEPRPIRALILTPTRELALQIYENLCEYGRYTGRVSTVIYGGVSQVPQVNALRRGVDVLVATPGRLWDLMQQNVVKINKVDYFILDEADRMLDMGFINDVRRVIKFLPEQRQTMLFSATMPKEIVDLAQTILINPLSISVAPSAKPIETIEQGVFFVDKMAKREMLKVLLKDRSVPQTLVFTRTKHGADRVTKELNRAGISALAIHGDKSQGARQSALKSFKDYKIAVLVATDIAARGIDIDDLPLVVNFDLPNEPETYVHRIGRTGRRGLSGTALSFCDESELPYLSDIERTTGANIPELTPPAGLERNVAIAEGRFVDGKRPKSNNKAQKRVTIPKPARTEAPKRNENTNRTDKPVADNAKARTLRNSEQRTTNRGSRGKNNTQSNRTAVATPAVVTEKKERSVSTERRRSNKPQGAPVSGHRRGGRRVEDNEPRVDVVTPRDKQAIADSTAARIRAKIEAKIAARTMAPDEIKPSNRTGSSHQRRSRQKKD